MGELINYFRHKQEEVIIVMFGDHYPHIIDFTEYLYGKDVALLSTEDYSDFDRLLSLFGATRALKRRR